MPRDQEPREDSVLQAAMLAALGVCGAAGLAYVVVSGRPAARKPVAPPTGLFAPRPPEPDPIPVAAPAPPPPVPAAAAPAPAPAPVQPDDGLSPEDRAALIAAIGPLTPENLLNAGRKFLELASVKGADVQKRPKAAAWLVNNEHVIKGFFEQPRVAQICVQPKPLLGYWSDPRSADGIGRDVKTFRRGLDTPGTPEAVVSSKLMDAVLARCSAVPTVGQNPHAMMAASRANPELVALMLDPRVVKAVAANPRFRKVISDINASMLMGKLTNAMP